MPAKVILKPGRDKSVRQHHPWIFSGAVARIEGAVEDGAVVEVAQADGAFLARGTLNRQSQIVVRLLSWDADEAIFDGFWHRRLERSILARPAGPGALRLVNAEADGLPGLIVDRYGPWLALQALTLGMDQRKARLAELIARIHQEAGREILGVYERSDADVRAKEGLEKATGVLWGAEPPELVEIADAPGGACAGEKNLRLLADLKRGQKTGFYLDQRDNRRAAARWCGGGEVLNLFSYTGAFAVEALAAGARRVVSVDSSAEALALARRNLELNGFAVNDEDFVEANVFEVLRLYRTQERRFDAIILDPPKLAFTAAQVERAARAYKDLNMIAMQILRPGGILVTFSCSGRISPDLFQKIVFGASLDAGREAQILEKRSHPPDHPILLSFPEGEYLKGLICRVL